MAFPEKPGKMGYTIYVHSHKLKRSKNERMEQLKAMVEYGSRKASPDVLKPRNIYIYIYTIIIWNRFIYIYICMY